MGLEVATYISQLNPANPLANDFIREADDHMRLIKQTLQNTFPNIATFTTVTEAELNLLSGATGFPSPGGLDTYVQFNNSGVFGGSSNLTFDGTSLTAAEAIVTGTVTLGFVDTSSNGIVRASNTGASFISGGDTQNTGAVLTLFGGANASFAGDVTIGVDGDADFFEWDNSAGTIQFNTGVGVGKTATATFAPTQVTIGNYVFDADQAVGPTEDGYLLEYDDASGEIRLAVPPAGTGNVQISGTPANDQIAVWTSATAIEGTAKVTFDGVSDIFRAGDGVSTYLSWEGDQLLGYNAGDIFFEALQSELNIRSSDAGDPTAADPIEIFISMESLDTNRYAQIGFNSGDELQFIDEVWGGEIRFYGDDAAGVQGIILTMKADESEVAFLEGYNTPVVIQGNTGAHLGGGNGVLLLENGATLYMSEVASAQADVLTYGQWWVRSSDGAAMFTREDGTDFELTAAGSVTRNTPFGIIGTATSSSNVSVLEFRESNDSVVQLTMGMTINGNNLTEITNHQTNGQILIGTDNVAASTGATFQVGGDTYASFSLNRFLITTNADLAFNEKADHSYTPSPGIGQVWVRNDNPCVLVYTDDVGTDFVIGGSGVGVPGGADTELQYNNGGAFGGMGTALTFNDSTLQVSMDATINAGTAFRISSEVTTGFTAQLIDDSAVLTSGTMLNVISGSTLATGNLVDIELTDPTTQTATALRVRNFGPSGVAIDVPNGYVDVGNIRFDNATTTIETTADDLNIGAFTGLINFNDYIGSYPGAPTDGQVLSYVAANSRFELMTPTSGFTVVVETTTTRNAAAFEIVMVDDDTAGAPVTINLPPGATDAQVIVNKRGSTANVTVDGDAAETINGAATFVLTAQYASVTVAWTGTEWAII